MERVDAHHVSGSWARGSPSPVLCLVSQVDGENFVSTSSQCVSWAIRAQVACGGGPGTVEGTGASFRLPREPGVGGWAWVTEVLAEALGCDLVPGVWSGCAPPFPPKCRPLETEECGVRSSGHMWSDRGGSHCTYFGGRAMSSPCQDGSPTFSVSDYVRLCRGVPTIPGSGVLHPSSMVGA